MKPTTALTLAPALTPARTTPPTVLEMIDRVTGDGHGMTQERVAAMVELVKLQERIEDRNAQKEFTRAFRDLQEELPTIVAQTIIPNRGKYERFEDLMKVVRPILHKHGFAIRFSQPMDKEGRPIVEAGRVTAIGKLSHVGGHSEVGQFTVRSSGKSDSETQADTKAATTAKRYCLSQMLNLVIRQDEDDASLEGHPINPDQVIELRRLVKATGEDAPDGTVHRTTESSFLKFAAAKDFESIMSNRYEELHEYLSKRERLQKQKAGQ